MYQVYLIIMLKGYFTADGQKTLLNNSNSSSGSISLHL